MDEVLFKAVAKGINKWIEGSYVKTIAFDGTNVLHRICLDDKMYPDWEGTMIDIDLPTLCQFTGMEDCVGTRVFRYDKVSIYIQNYYSNHHITTEGDITVEGVVIYNNYHWSVEMSDGLEIPLSDVEYESMMLTVIGNRHDVKEKS